MSTNRPIRSPAKRQLIAFIRESKANVPYQFIVLGTEPLAEKFVHQMRVELSRMREKVRMRNAIPRAFKIILQNISYDASKDTCTVTIVQTTNATSTIHNDVDEILNQISGGNKI